MGPATDAGYVGVLNFHGLLLGVEHAAGSVNPWSGRVTRASYGEFPGTLGNDGDPIDFLLGGDWDSTTAYVLQQRVPNGQNEGDNSEGNGGPPQYDEDKVVLGATSEADACALFADYYHGSGREIGGVLALTLAELVDLLGRPERRGFALFKAAPNAGVSFARQLHVRALTDELVKGPSPSGAGWALIPGGKKGGYRKMTADGWAYWYPTASDLDSGLDDDVPREADGVGPEPLGWDAAAFFGHDRFVPGSATMDDVIEELSELLAFGAEADLWRRAIRGWVPAAWPRLQAVRTGAEANKLVNEIEAFFHSYRERSYVKKPAAAGSAQPLADRYSTPTREEYISEQLDAERADVRDALEDERDDEDTPEARREEIDQILSGDGLSELATKRLGSRYDRLDGFGQLHDLDRFLPDPAVVGAAGLALARSMSDSELLTAAQAARDRAASRLGLRSRQYYSELREPSTKPTQHEALVIRAAALFTGSSVECVRDPERFDAQASKKGAGIGLWREEPPTKEDYQIAHVIMSRLSTIEDPAVAPRKLYRGMDLPQPVRDEVTPPPVRSLDLRAVSSWSPDRRVAESFGGVLFEVETRRGFELGALSEFPSEREWVLGGEVHLTETLDDQTIRAEVGA